MDTDFFDEDLASSDRSPDSSTERSAGDAGGEREIQPAEPPAAPVSDLDLGRLAKERRRLHGRVAGTVHEMEQLEQRQSELEQRKNRLQELTRKQELYERGKREIVQKLDRGIIVIEKDEIQSSRRADMLKDMRMRFRESLDEITAIDEESWAAEQFEQELDRALVRVDESSMLYKKSIAKIDALGGKGGALPPLRSGVDPNADRALRAPGSFRAWLIAGLAFSLPISIVLIVLCVVYLLRMGML